MNTKSLPAILALIAGFVTCIMSFVQQVDTVVFAKRFVIVCFIFFAIGTVASVVIQMNFKQMKDDGKDGANGEGLPEEDEDGQENAAAQEDVKE